MTLTYGSLFSGIGGIDLGLDRAGFKCAWQVEYDDFCTQILERHWPDVRRHRDVTTFLVPDADQLRREGLEEELGPETALDIEGGDDPPRRRVVWRGADYGCDLIVGGFPCQPVSQAGRRKSTADDRWLWPDMRRVLEVVAPRWVLVENVPGLLSIDDGRVFGAILRDLAALGYSVEWDCIPACAVGAPHLRDRVFIVGRRTGADALSSGLRSDRHPQPAGPAAAGEGEGLQRQRLRPHAESVGEALADAARLRGRSPADGPPWEGAGAGGEGGVVHDADRGGRRHHEAGSPAQPGGDRADDRVPRAAGDDVPDADEGGRRTEGGGLRPVRPTGERGPGSADGGAAAADPRCWVLAAGWESRPAPVATERPGDGDHPGGGTTVGGLGGATDGLPDGVVIPGYHAWPDGWEVGVPRLATHQPHRRARLRALGNAVVPSVAEFLGRRIIAVDTFLRGG